MSDPDLEALGASLAQVRQVVVGQERVMERLLACLLAGGHALLEGVPGVGKTVMLEALSSAMGGAFARIQFTADLMPSDIVGTRIYRPSKEDFVVETGPVFANFVLADEVNRAPAKVQSAMLEVMAEGQVTLGGQTFVLPKPFLVLATQNPIDSEGTYPLPEAQRDRFLMRVMVDYPTPAEEWQVLEKHSVAAPQVTPVMTPEQVVALQHRARTLYMDEAVAHYAHSLVLATRDPAQFGLPDLAPALTYGASPRASLGLIRAARGIALLRGRSEVSPQDVYDVAYDVLNHRLLLSYAALTEGTTVDEVLSELLRGVSAPPTPSGRPLAGSAPRPSLPSPGPFAVQPTRPAPPPPHWSGPPPLPRP